MKKSNDIYWVRKFRQINLLYFTDLYIYLIIYTHIYSLHTYTVYIRAILHNYDIYILYCVYIPLFKFPSPKTEKYLLIFVKKTLRCFCWTLRGVEMSEIRE